MTAGSPLEYLTFSGTRFVKDAHPFLLSDSCQPFEADILGGISPSDFPDVFRGRTERLLTSTTCRELWDKYIDMVARIHALRKEKIRTSCICATGTLALHAAIDSADLYQRMLGRHRVPLACSTQSHTSLTQFRKEEDRILLPAEATPGQVIDLLRKRTPAIYFLTLGLTDNGELESLPEEIEVFCLEADIPIGLDVSAGTVYPLLPDRACTFIGADQRSRIKQYHNVMQSPAVKFVICGLGKFIGPLSLSCMFCLDDKPETQLHTAACVACHQLDDDYLPTNGHFGGRTIGERVGLGAIQQVDALGLDGLRMLALHAHLSAAEIANDLRHRKILVDPVRTHSIHIPLNSQEEAYRVAHSLKDEHLVACAFSRRSPAGIRITLNVGHYISEDMQQSLSDAVYESVTGRFPVAIEPTEGAHFMSSQIALPGPRTFTMVANVPRCYWLESQYKHLSQFYSQGALLPPEQCNLPTNQSFLLTRNAINALHYIEFRTGCHTSSLRNALISLNLNSNSHLFPNKQFTKDALEYFLRLTSPVKYFCELPNDDSLPVLTDLKTQKKEAQLACHLVGERLQRVVLKHRLFSGSGDRQQRQIKRILETFLQSVRPAMKMHELGIKPFPYVDPAYI